MRRRTRLLIGIPLLAVFVLAVLLLALPGFVASTTHRATIEALASSLTGREVHIGGKLSLALLPTPQLVADQITIAAPAETITAKSLTLNIALPDLLRGKLNARSLTLQSPDVKFPWPLPRGPVSIAPPPWLTTSHAQIVDGSISVGAVRFTAVTADVFTDSGAVSISGTAMLGRLPLDLSLSLGAANFADQAPLSLDATASDASKMKLHFSGAIDEMSTFSGTLTAAGIVPGDTKTVAGTAAVQGDSNGIAVSDLKLTAQDTSIAGTAQLTFSPLAINAQIGAQNLDLLRCLAAYEATPAVALHLDLSATNSSAAGFRIPQLRLQADGNGNAISWRNLTASLPGDTTVSSAGGIDATGRITGQANLSAADLTSLAAAYEPGLALPANWGRAQLKANLAGNQSQLALSALQGSLGNSTLNGGLVFAHSDGRVAIQGNLHFGELDLTPLIHAMRGFTGLNRERISGEITADRATINNILATNLLLDATVDQDLVVRRVSAAAYGGLVSASFNISQTHNIAAQAVLSLPSATPLNALLPPAWQLPASLAHAPLSISLAALGPSNALATSAAATLGDITASTAPVLNIANLSATGPLTLRYPNAIAGLAAFGIKSSLAWPGAGSASLRANFTATPKQWGLPNFVASFGDLTANGRFLVSSNNQIDAEIDADTLALPPIPANLAIPWPQLANLRGAVKLNANRILLNGQQVLAASQANLTLAPNLLTLQLPHIGWANGTLSGSFKAITSDNMAPTFTADLKLDGADATAINLSMPFPWSLASGSVSAQAALTASGYTPAIWVDTLGGSATLSASNGVLTGFSLSGLTQALNTPQRTKALQTAATSGQTSFSSLQITGKADHGAFSLGNAALAGTEGNTTATGSVDLPDKDLALNLSLQPKAAPPVTIGLSTLGAWNAPKQIPDLSDAESWTAATP